MTNALGALEFLQFHLKWLSYQSYSHACPSLSLSNPARYPGCPRNGVETTSVMLHPSAAFGYQAFPHPETRVITRENLQALKTAVRAFVVTLTSDELNVGRVGQLLVAYGLTPALILQKYSTNQLCRFDEPRKTCRERLGAGFLDSQGRLRMGWLHKCRNFCAVPDVLERNPHNWLSNPGSTQKDAVSGLLIQTFVRFPTNKFDMACIPGYI